MKKFIIVIMVMFFSFISATTLFAAANIWTQKADFGGLGRYGAVGFSIESKGYIGTGSSYDPIIDNTYYSQDFWEYDPVANTWTQKADFGGSGRYEAVGFSIGDKGYIGTGSSDSGATKDFWEYDSVANTWTQKKDFGGTERYAAVGFSIGDKGYIGTGHGEVFSSLYKDFWEYDSVANTWTQKKDFGGTARALAVGFSIGDKGYIGTVGYLKKDFWEYDPVANTWTQKADFGGLVRYGAVGFSIGDKGFMGTGYCYNADTDDSYDSKDFWEYDPAVDTWTRKKDFGGKVREGAVGFSIGDKGYIGTGIDFDFELDANQAYRKDFWKYDLTDTTPNKFKFTAKKKAALNTLYTSNTIKVAGIDTATDISIVGGTYSINGGPYTSADGTVIKGNTVNVQQTSAGSCSTQTDVTLTIGDVSGTFSVITAPPDTTPNHFKFIAQTKVPVSTLITSNTITVSGINVAAPISITVGGTYSINGGPYTDAIGTVENGDTVTLQQTSSASYHTKTTVTLTIGTVKGVFSVTTLSH